MSEGIQLGKCRIVNGGDTSNWLLIDENGVTLVASALVMSPRRVVESGRLEGSEGPVRGLSPGIGRTLPQIRPPTVGIGLFAQDALSATSAQTPVKAPLSRDTPPAPLPPCGTSDRCSWARSVRLLGFQFHPCRSPAGGDT